MHALALIFIPFISLGTVIYFIPTIVALAKSKHNTLTIFLLNFFLGWSVIGWVVALVLSLRDDVQRVRAY